MSFDPDLEIGTRLERALIDIGYERKRQDRLKAEGRFEHTPADDISNEERFLMLGEEFGEVAGQVLGLSGDAHDRPVSLNFLRKELIHVAAISAAWVEGLDEHGLPKPPKR